MKELALRKGTNQLPEPEPGYLDTRVLMLSQIQEVTLLNNNVFIAAPVQSDGQPDKFRKVLIFDGNRDNTCGVVPLTNITYPNATQIWQAEGLYSPTATEAADFYTSVVDHARQKRDITDALLTAVTQTIAQLLRDRRVNINAQNREQDSAERTFKRASGIHLFP